MVDSEVLANYSSGWMSKSKAFPLVTNMFYKKGKPKEGDMVEMRARKYRNGRTGYCDAKITRILDK